LVPLSGTLALMGGQSVLVGFQTRLGAALLVVFLIPVTFEMHRFWTAPDATTSLNEQAMFMKNLSMLGGALIISYFGAGPLSLDAFVEGEDGYRRRSPASPAASANPGDDPRMT